jgi:hypothetical protein
VYGVITIPETVIPERPAGLGPESENMGLWKMASGLAAAPRPGMTSLESLCPVHFQQAAIILARSFKE